jgi:nitroimidazol reductase NimA-like FMN-containing flavoprotein (pyridoxamine 5'-phosphate oxidase superfamily)
MNADTRTHWFKGHLRDASRKECFEFLESQQVGRVVFDDPDGPVALPVNFTVHDEGVVIATSPTSSLSRYAPGHVVGFEVDEIDEFNESGWSVLLRGVASVLAEGRIDDDDRPNPWVEGDRTLLIRISCLQVSGRYLLSA